MTKEAIERCIHSIERGRKDAQGRFYVQCHMNLEIALAELRAALKELETPPTWAQTQEPWQ